MSATILRSNVTLPLADMTEAQFKTRRCRSRSRFGRCGIDQGHEGNHKVPICHHGAFDYDRRGRAIGYVFEALP